MCFLRSMSFVYHMYCLHPVKVNTPNGVKLLPCCKCEACVLHRSQSGVYPLLLEQSTYKYCYFVTLTYRNDAIGKLYMRKENIDEQNCTYDCVFCDYDTNDEKFREHVYSDGRFEKQILKVLYSRKTSIYGILTYAPYIHYQKFINNLRKYYSKYFGYEKIRYYTVTEYGPRTYRAHWHCLLFSNEEDFALHISEALHHCWPLGDIRYRLASDGYAAKYAAQYVNSFISLPEICKNPFVRPRQRHSNFLGSKAPSLDVTTFFGQGHNYFVDKYYQDGIKLKPLHVFRSFEAQVFFKCVGYAEKSASQRKFSYLVYTAAKDIFGEYPVTTLSELIASASIFSNPLTAYFYEHYPPAYVNFMRPASMPVLKLQQKDDTLPWQGYEAVNENYVFDADEYKTFVGRIARYLYISKKALSVCEKYGGFRRWFFFNERYFDEKDYYNLIDQYQRQENDAKDGILRYTIASYYDNMDDYPARFPVEWQKKFEDNNSPYYQYLEIHAKQWCYDKIKHKEYNDLSNFLVAKEVPTITYKLKNHVKCNEYAQVAEPCF